MTSTQTEPAKHVWNKLAVHGVFRGHPSGPFEMNASTFSEIVANFDREGLPVPIDYEHASEAPATSGTIPVAGAPAQGWIHTLQARTDGLWGLVEWLPKAREQIRNGEYRYISPAIRFGARNQVTGEKVGAKLSSAGLSNQPFLKALPPLVARDAGDSGAFICSDVHAEPALVAALCDKAKYSIGDRVEATVNHMPKMKGMQGAVSIAREGSPPYYGVTFDGTDKVHKWLAQNEIKPAAGAAMKMADEDGDSDTGGYMWSSDSFLPEFRCALGMDALASPSDMLARVDRLEELVDQADGDPSAVVEGIALSNYIGPLRDLMRLPMNTTLADLLEAVAEMIESCLPGDDEQEEDGTPTAANMSEGVQSPEATPLTKAGSAPASKKEFTMDTISMSEHKVALSDAIASATAPLTLQLKDAEAKVAAADAAKAQAEAKVVELSEQLKHVADKALADRVDEAFVTYKDSRKLSDADKEAMPIVLSTNPALFDKLYPRVPVAQQALLRVVSKDGSTSKVPTGAKTIPTVLQLCDKAQRDNPSKSYDDCFSLALIEQAKLLASG